MPNERDTVSLRIESMFEEISISASYNPKIYKVHDELRQVNERAYDPVLVSIGPIHHNKDHLKPMEKIKASYLHHFLQVKNETVDKYVVKLRQLEGRARDRYSNLIQLPEGDKFVEMLLLDGFFVIQLLRKLNSQNWRVNNDHIFQLNQTTNRVIIDLLLVENQLPFFILSQLFDMTKTTPQDKLTLLVLRELCGVLPWKKIVDLQIDEQRVDDHLLGMVHSAYCCTFQYLSSGRPTYEGINTAVELKETGIQFEVVRGASLTDLSFTFDGVMQLPYLFVDDSTETILRNLIAYEQLLTKPGLNYVSNYVELMNYLLNSSKDVEILRRAGIFRTMLGDDETVQLMFNKLGKHIIIDNENVIYLEVFQRVNMHYSRRRNKWMAMLRRNYLHSPWTILSVIAAFVLLFLTATQTVYSILSYDK